MHGVLGVDGDLLLLTGQERRGPVEEVVEVMDKVSFESEESVVVSSLTLLPVSANLSRISS